MAGFYIMAGGMVAFALFFLIIDFIDEHRQKTRQPR